MSTCKRSRHCDPDRSPSCHTRTVARCKRHHWMPLDANAKLITERPLELSLIEGDPIRSISNEASRYSCLDGQKFPANACRSCTRRSLGPSPCSSIWTPPPSPSRRSESPKQVQLARLLFPVLILEVAMFKRCLDMCLESRLPPIRCLAWTSQPIKYESSIPVHAPCPFTASTSLLLK